LAGGDLVGEGETRAVRGGRQAGTPSVSQDDAAMVNRLQPARKQGIRGPLSSGYSNIEALFEGQKIPYYFDCNTVFIVAPVVLDGWSRGANTGCRLYGLPRTAGISRRNIEKYADAYLYNLRFLGGTSAPGRG
jgi:hypothetical protein